MLVHPNSAVKLLDFRPDLHGQVIAVKLSAHSHSWQILNVYAPNNHTERSQFFDNLWRYKFPNLDAIVVGEFNCIPDLALHKWGGDDSFGDKAVTQLHAFTQSLDLEDVYRQKNPSGWCFTSFNGSHSVGCRLDRFYIPRNWRARVTDNLISTFAYSDHRLLSLKISFGHSNPRGRGLWKFNTSLLKSEAFCSALNDFWPGWREIRPTFIDPRIWWDAGKLQLKELAIAHSVSAARERKREKLILEREFSQILTRGTPNTVADQRRLAKLKSLLQAIEDQAVEGAIIRSKEQWLELGERPTQYFYQLENKRQTRNAINELRVNDMAVTSNKEILSACRSFYKSLYSEEPVDFESQDWLLDQLDTALSGEDQLKCEGDITLAECSVALSQTTTGKSPGNDGFPVEFYRRFWGLLGRDLVDTLNYSFHNGDPLGLSMPGYYQAAVQKGRSSGS